MPRKIPAFEGQRRLDPRLWDYSYYLMTPIRKRIRRVIESELPVRSQSCVVDLGCGWRPSKPGVSVKSRTLETSAWRGSAC